jgi:hypothetical protein
VYVNFGDGVSGAVPLNFSEVRALYTVGGGVIGNVSVGVLTNFEYVPGLSSNDVTALQAVVTVTNDEVALGGADPESLSQIRYAAPLTLRANTRAITLEDFRSLALGVANSGDQDQQPGLDEAQVPTSEYTDLAADVYDAVSPRTLIGSSVTIQPPVYVDVIISIQYAKLPQYTDAEVQASIKSVMVSNYGYVNIDFGQTIYQQDIETILNTTARGVKVAKVVVLHRVGDTGLQTLTSASNEILRFKEENISVGVIV